MRGGSLLGWEEGEAVCSSCRGRQQWCSNLREEIQEVGGWIGGMWGG